MSGWNYRVIEFTSSATVGPDEKETWRAIHEVHYNQEGAPVLYSSTPAVVLWDIEEGNESAIRSIDRMKEALSKPVLKESDFFKNAEG